MARRAMDAADEALTPRLMADVDLYAPLSGLEERADLRGRREINGRDAWVLHADDLEGVEGMDALRSGKLTLWLDADRYVPLRAEIEGDAEIDGDWRAVKLTVTQKNYRESGGMLFPSRSVTTVAGATPDTAEADSAELERKLARAKQQLERMPPAQRKMAEQMMNAQLGQMDAMLAPGPMRFETSLVEARVNQGPPDELVQQVKDAFAATPRTPE